MQSELIHGSDKVIYKDYIGALRNYHIPYFDRTFITSIDQDKILTFEGWRIETAGKVPAKSTILTHNAALRSAKQNATKFMMPLTQVYAPAPRWKA